MLLWVRGETLLSESCIPASLCLLAKCLWVSHVMSLGEAFVDGVRYEDT